MTDFDNFRENHKSHNEEELHNCDSCFLISPLGLVNPFRYSDGSTKSITPRDETSDYVETHNVSSLNINDIELKVIHNDTNEEGYKTAVNTPTKQEVHNNVNTRVISPQEGKQNNNIHVRNNSYLTTPESINLPLTQSKEESLTSTGFKLSPDQSTSIRITTNGQSSPYPTMRDNIDTPPELNNQTHEHIKRMTNERDAKHIQRQKDMTKIVAEARRRYRQARQDALLGLTPSVGGTPYNMDDPPSAQFQRWSSVDKTFQHGHMETKEEHKEHEEELQFRRKTFWKSCCGMVIDKRSTQYFIQVFISMVVVSFCIAKIWTAKTLRCSEGEDTTIYFTLLGTTVGQFIQAPSMGDHRG